MFIAALFIRYKTWKQPTCPLIDACIKKMWGTHTLACTQWNTCSIAQLCLTLWDHGLQHTRLHCPSPSPSVCSISCPLSQWCIQLSHPLLPPSPFALNLSQHQGLFQWVSSSHQVAKVLELQSFQWVNGILLIHKKEWHNAICNNLNGPRNYYTKWSKSDRKIQISYDISYMWNLKKLIQMNLLAKGIDS